MTPLLSYIIVIIPHSFPYTIGSRLTSMYLAFCSKIVSMVSMVSHIYKKEELAFSQLSIYNNKSQNAEANKLLKLNR